MADQKVITLYPGNANAEDIVLRALPAADATATINLILRALHATPQTIIIQSTTATSGGTNYNEALTEAASAADALTHILAGTNAQTEAAAATDATTTALAGTNGLTEAATASDANTTALSASHAVAESATAIDSLTGLQSAPNAVSEAATASDALTHLLAATHALSEAATAGDATTGGIAYTEAISEAANATDTLAETLTPAAASPSAGGDVPIFRPRRYRAPPNLLDPERRKRTADAERKLARHFKDMVQEPELGPDRATMDAEAGRLADLAAAARAATQAAEALQAAKTAALLADDEELIMLLAA